MDQYRLNLYKFKYFKSTELKFVYILLLLLLFFGKSFTKIPIFGPFHAYDLALLFLTIYVIIKNGITFKYFKSLSVFFLVSLLYLVLSIWVNNPLQIIIRQYALFAYIILSYFIIFPLIKKNETDVLYLIKNISLISVIAQFVYVVYAYISGTNPTSYSEKLYLSPLIIMGVITSLSYVLVMVPKREKFIKVLFVIVILTISYLIGHASAFLSALFVLFLYLFLNFNRIFKLITLPVFILLITFLSIYSADFNDSNASWRLIYWSHALNAIIHDNFLIFGEGFGVRYAPDSIINIITQQLGADHLGEENNSYLTPFHNSFLTIFFHIGFLPSMIIIIPVIISFFKRLFNNNEKSPSKDFILLNVIGLSIWAAFNVILELPHSSFFYWINYFTMYYLFIVTKVKTSRKSDRHKLVKTDLKYENH